MSVTRFPFSPTIKLRCDMFDAWKASNVILRDGELVVAVKEDGSTEIRVGNGLHTFMESTILNAATTPDNTYMYFNVNGSQYGKWQIQLINSETKKAWEEKYLHPEEDSISKLEEVI